MTIPNGAAIELPLLLELQRAGGRVRSDSDVYERIGNHFPLLTVADKEQKQQSKEELVWRNNVQWARDVLRKKGELDGGERGVWEITDAGRVRLRRELANLGVGDVEAFMASRRTIPEEIGLAWQPEPLRQHPRASGRRKEQVTVQPPPPVVEQATTQEVRSPLPAGEHEAQSPIGERLLTRLLALSPSEFEKLVCKLLKAKGFSNVELTAQPYDKGIDGKAEISMVKLRVAVQAKHYSTGTNVGIDPVQRLLGSMGNAFDRGIFITTSGFTPAAEGWVQETNAPLVLIDGRSLVSQMVELRLGIKETPVVETKVDEDFFGSLS